MLEKIKKIYTFICFKIFMIFPLQNKIVFSNFSGKRYGDNPKIISEYIGKNYPQIKQVWLLKKGNKVPDNIKLCKWGSLSMIYHLATSKIWIDSHTKPIWTKKRKSQFYINTWHGGLGIKKIEGDAIEKLSHKDILRTKHNSKLVDLFISNSDWLTQIYRRAFWYSGKILKLGYPKDDFLKQSNKIEIKNKIYEYLNLSNKCKLVLYAPTMRENVNSNPFDLDMNKLIENLKQKFKGEWKILIRLHPVNQEYASKLVTNDNVIDVTHYPDILELIIASEILITDYSSCIFDAALLKKKALLYTSDEETFEKERGMYMKLEDLPFYVSRSNKELENTIKNYNYNNYLKLLENYYKNVGYYSDGHATEKIVKIILDKMEVRI